MFDWWDNCPTSQTVKICPERRGGENAMEYLCKLYNIRNVLNLTEKEFLIIK